MIGVSFPGGIVSEPRSPRDRLLVRVDPHRAAQEDGQ